MRKYGVKPGFPGGGAREFGLKRAALGGRRKRLFDFVIGSIALVVLTPIMLATAVLIRLLMGEDIIVAEDLIGFGGHAFAGYKFRTTIGNAKGMVREPKNTPWAESLGEALRKSSLDKLPQFFNVVRGDMSLVGPKPIMADELLRYRAYAPEVFIARPGLTGIWHAHRRNHRTRIALDRYYVRHWSMRLDFALLIKAFSASLRGNETA